MSSTRGKLGGAAAAVALGGSAEIDPEASGGAYLLGLRRLGVVPHGRFRAPASPRRSCAPSRPREDLVGQYSARALRSAGALQAFTGVRGGR